MGYWDNKETLMQQAAYHYNLMECQYGLSIQDAVRHTVLFYGEDALKIPDKGSKSQVMWHCCITEDDNKTIAMHNADKSIFVVSMDSVTAAFNYAYGNTCILNFASYKNPGGKFLEGSSAQEESLCHASTLYNVLKKFDSYYKENNTNVNKSLYTNRALYTPGIVFFGNDGRQGACSVLTCAAPNFTAASKYNQVSKEENSKVLDSRVRFMLKCMKESKIDTMILGAWGCGVFGQNPKEVADRMSFWIKALGIGGRIVFAIPGGRNFDAFEKVFCD